MMNNKIELRHPGTGELYDTIDVYAPYVVADVCIDITQHMSSGKKLNPENFIYLDMLASQARDMAYKLLKCADEADKFNREIDDYFFKELQRENEKLKKEV